MIIRRPGAIDIDNLISGPHKITYEAPQYVKLSAKSSIEGAAPSHERFEDFAKGLDLTQVHLGNTIKQWKNTGSPDEPVWDGDVRGDQEDDVFDPDDPDYPDPPDPWGDEPDNNENVGNTAPPDDYIHDYYDNDYSWACLQQEWYRLRRRMNLCLPTLRSLPASSLPVCGISLIRQTGKHACRVQVSSTGIRVRRVYRPSIWRATTSGCL